MFLSFAGVLLGFGILMVHSASITSWPTTFEQVYLSRHVSFLAVGLLVGATAAFMPGRFWFRLAPFLFMICVCLLVLVLIPGVGTKVNGAQRWLRVGSYSFQPSELAKISLPLFLCYLMRNRRENLHHWFRGTVPLVVPIAIMIPLVMLQPDLGTSIFLVAIGGMALFLSGWPIRNFVLAVVCVVPALVSLVAMKPYQMRRITGFLAAWSDFDQAPYQLKQSLVTLGAGGVSGVGLGRGWQKLSFLPEANTDFVFAVVGEELGLVGTMSLIALWMAIYISGLKVLAHLNKRSFAYVVSFTLLTQIVLQAALNVAVVTGMVPPKGISHPFVSYGGSNLVVTLLALGIILSLSRSCAEDDQIVLG